MNHFVSGCNLLKSEDSSVMIVHHSDHNNELARGNSAFYATLDGEIYLRKMNNSVTLSFTKITMHQILTI